MICDKCGWNDLGTGYMAHTCVAPNEARQWQFKILHDPITIKVAKAIKKWCRARKLILTQEPCHIHARAYVLGYTAPQCLIVAIPWIDSEPQLRPFDKKNPLTALHTFDASLMPGDWCSTAYVCYEGVQETVAIRVVA